MLRAVTHSLHLVRLNNEYSERQKDVAERTVWDRLLRVLKAAPKLFSNCSAIDWCFAIRTEVWLQSNGRRSFLYENAVNSIWTRLKTVCCRSESNGFDPRYTGKVIKLCPSVMVSGAFCGELHLFPQNVVMHDNLGALKDYMHRIFDLYQAGCKYLLDVAPPHRCKIRAGWQWHARN